MGNSTPNAAGVVVVVDGRPGHEKQSFGITSALAEKVKIQTTVIDLSKKGLGAQVKSYIRFLLNLPIADISLAGNACLVIGTGSRTHSTVLHIKRQMQIPAITCMTPARHLRDLFDVCFVPEHDGCAERNNYFFTCGAPNVCRDKQQHREDSGLIVLGGIDEKSHVWDSKDICTKISRIVSQERKKHWVIASSPRTPDITVSAIRDLAKKTDNAEFFDYKETEKGWIEKQYDKCATVWVTSDSISMLYEALSSGCRVNVIQMPWKNTTGKFKRNEDLLIEKNLITPFDMWEKDAGQKHVRPQLNEAQRCADYILQKCWPKN